mmetsp:Transcript_5641/g.16583  ORF Transcript_5641/g.16583 Transcript_5641/m.16583 type:complete len:320 (+) Transcript_5641:791-1750(+)
MALSAQRGARQVRPTLHHPAAAVQLHPLLDDHGRPFLHGVLTAVGPRVDLLRLWDIHPLFRPLLARTRRRRARGLARPPRLRVLDDNLRQPAAPGRRIAQRLHEQEAAICRPARRKRRPFAACVADRHSGGDARVGRRRDTRRRHQGRFGGWRALRQLESDQLQAGRAQQASEPGRPLHTDERTRQRAGERVGTRGHARAEFLQGPQRLHRQPAAVGEYIRATWVEWSGRRRARCSGPHADDHPGCPGKLVVGGAGDHGGAHRGGAACERVGPQAQPIWQEARVEGQRRPSHAQLARPGVDGAHERSDGGGGGDGHGGG